MPQAITLTRTIQAPVHQVYRSFANRDDVCDWLCYDADLLPEAGGYLFLIWREGRYAFGIFSAVEENHRLALSWQDNAQPGVTQVEVTLEAQDGATALTLQHGGITDSDAAAYYAREWEGLLNNLQSILETGANLTITERVLVGIYVGPFDATIAGQLGVPVTDGVRVGGLVPGLSAAASGLQVNDVIVEAEGQPLTPTYTLPDAARGKRPGDTITVGFYRGAEKHTVKVTLKGYPLPEFPSDFNGLADMLERTHAGLEPRMVALFDGIDEARLHRAVPDTGQTVLESLATLVLTERITLEWLSTYTYPDAPRRTTMRITPEKRAALLAVYPTPGALVGLLRNTWGEIIALLRALPESLLERKNYLWWITYEIDPDQRLIAFYLDQIAAAVSG